MKKLRIGILGCANIAKKHILPAIESLQSKFQLEGIASRDNLKAKMCASTYNCNIFDSYESLIEDSNIDVVYIPLPNALHFKWIMKALANGIHVLSEKSLSCSLLETQKIISRAKEKKLVVIENFQFRFHPQLKYILNLLERDEIGELRCMRSSFGFSPFADKNNIRYSNELGGGALLDAGAYPVKLSQMILGNNISATSAKLSYNSSNVDIWGGAFLSSSDSALFSEIAFGFDNYYQCNLELWGSKGKIVADKIFTASPGYQPTITIESTFKKETKLIPAENHFVKMLEYVHSTILNGNFEGEYKQNLNQSRLLEEIRKLAKE